MIRKTRFSLPARLSNSPERDIQRKLRRSRRSSGSTSTAQSTLTQIEFVNKVPSSSGSGYDENDDIYNVNSEEDERPPARKRRRLSNDEDATKKHYTQTLTQLGWIEIMPSDEDDVDDLADRQLKSESHDLYSDEMVPNTPVRRTKNEIPSSQSPASPETPITPTRIPEIARVNEARRARSPLVERISNICNTARRPVGKKVRLRVEDTYTSAESESLHDATSGLNQPTEYSDDTVPSSMPTERAEIPDSGDESESDGESEQVQDSLPLSPVNRTILRDEIQDSDAESDISEISNDLEEQSDPVDPTRPQEARSQLQQKTDLDPDVEDSQIIFAIPPLPSSARSRRVWTASQATTEDDSVTQSQDSIGRSPLAAGSSQNRSQSSGSAPYTIASSQLLTKSQMMPDSLVNDDAWEPPTNLYQ